MPQHRTPLAFVLRELNTHRLIVALLGALVGAAMLPGYVLASDAAGPVIQPKWDPGPAWADVLVQGDYRVQRDLDTQQFRLTDKEGASQAAGSFDECQARLAQIVQQRRLAPPTGKAVIVLHGLMRSREMMRPLCRYLEQNSDYLLINVSYPSTRAELGVHAKNLASVIAHLEGVQELNFVGHSMGNLVIRHYLADQQAERGMVDPRIKRIVMIAPPNQGSELAEMVANSQFISTVLGASFGQLAAGLSKLNEHLAIPQCEFGIIAGGRGDGQGWNPLLPDDDDFTISVASTQLPGAADFLLLPLTHARLVFDSRTMQSTLRFLQQGYFIAADQRHALPQPPSADNSSDDR